MYFVNKWRINRRFQSVTEVQRELKQTFDKDLLQTWDKDIEFGVSNLVMETGMDFFR